MLRLRRAELAKAKLPVGAEPATPPASAERADDDRAVSDSMLAPEGPTFDSMLAPDPVPIIESVVAPEPSPLVARAVAEPTLVFAEQDVQGYDSIVAPEPEPPMPESIAVPEMTLEATPDSMVPAPDSMIPAPESIAAAPDSMLAAPDSVPRVSASVLLEPSASIPVLEPHTSEPPPESVSDTALTNRVPPPDADAEQALPFLPRGSLNSMVPGSRPIPDQRGFPSGMYQIELDEPTLVPPPDPKRLAARALPVTPLFSELGAESLAVLIASATLLHFEPGAVVYRQNDPSDKLFVVASGLVSIATEGENGVEIAQLGDNEFFGETALISNELRLSTARAVEPTDLLAIERRTVTELVQKDPRILKTVLRFLRERLVESMLLTNPLFTLLTGGERRELAKRFEFIEFERGSQLIRQRSRSPGVFVLLCGTVEVTRREGANVRLLALLHAGGVFGEMSLIGRDPAVADVRSMSRGFALMLPENEFRRVCEEHPQVLEFVQLLAEARKRQNAQPLPQESVPVSA
jgi:CRP-like cAMP-binding protein